MIRFVRVGVSNLGNIRGSEVYKDKKIAVVVPCYNEATQIEKVVSTMPDYVDAIIICDDKSTDRTVEVVQELQQRYPNVVLLQHEVNQGVGGAIASGYEYARDNNFDAAAVMAGDAQMNPDDLPALLDPVVSGETDYSKGNRLVYQSASRRIPFVRLFGNSVLSFLTKIASGYWHVADSQTGYTVIDRKPLEVIDWSSMYKRYGQPNDLLVKLNVHDFRVRDVPVEPVYGVGEQSGIKVRRVVFTISRLLLAGFLFRMKEKYIIRDFHPLVLFYFMGFLFGTLTAVFMVRLGYLWAVQGTAPLLTTIGMLSSFGFAMQSTFFGMIFDRAENSHLR